MTYLSFPPRRRLLVSLGWLLIVSVAAVLPVSPLCAATDKAKEIEVHIERPDGTDWAYPADAIPVCAWGFPGGGTYRWSAEGPAKATFAGDVGSTWMSVTEPGKYKVSVEYSLDGKRATDTKGTVIALEAGAKDGGGPGGPTVQTEIMHPDGQYHPHPLDDMPVTAWADPGPGTFAWSASGPGDATFASNEGSTWMSVTEPGRYTVSVTYTCEDGSAGDSEGTLIAVKADLVVVGVDEEDEEGPGAFVGVRGPRRKVELTYAPLEDLDYHVLTLSNGGGRLEFYLTETGGEAMSTFQWDDCPGSPIYGNGNWNERPSEVWVEGVSASDEIGDQWVRLHYSGISSSGNSGGHTDHVHFTVVQVDLVATDLVAQVPDQQEEDPGAYVHFNVDDDNASGTADYTEEVNPVVGEDDLKELNAWVAPADLDVGHLRFVRENASARLWSDGEKGAGNEVLVDQDSLDWDLSEQDAAAFNAAYNNSPGDELLVEGYAAGESAIMLEYRGPGDVDPVASDRVKYTFIAALCGDQPTPEQRQRLGEDWFPGLIHCEWSVTGDATWAYNCIASSAGIEDQWIDPTIFWREEYVEERWDPNFGRLVVSLDMRYGNSDNTFELDDDLDPFYAAECGLTTVQEVNGEPPNEDVQVMYYEGYHAAKKMDCGCGAGKWLMFESKNAWEERIEHVFDQLDPKYGTRIRYYK